ncbi:hypothetical protein dqs_1980 [Azoarcus olearius]|nr:hypothetical protein dqs_1980 [Azoarcus olearius]
MTIFWISECLRSIWASRWPTTSTSESAVESAVVVWARAGEQAPATSRQRDFRRKEGTMTASGSQLLAGWAVDALLAVTNCSDIANYSHSIHDHTKGKGFV